MCGWDAADNSIGEAGAVALAKALESGQCKLESLDVAYNSIGRLVTKRVADALHLSVLARVAAARCRLALAKGMSSRLCEQSVLRDMPIECISSCGSFCSAKLVLRFLMAQPVEAKKDTCAM